MIKAEIIADSVSPLGKRITTFQLRYPRWIHAELRTHRLLYPGERVSFESLTPPLMDDKNLSRNASSSRAVPVPRLIRDVLDDIAMPVYWGKNQRGMQADEQCDQKVKIDGRRYTREQAWMYAANEAVRVAEAFDKAGYHKQLINRLLEPFTHINVVVTATEWDNFFGLRIHPDAEPHIKLLAESMYKEMRASKPKLVPLGSWHLPYVKDKDWIQIEKQYRDPTEIALKVSAARCARVSYKTFEDKEYDYSKDLELYHKLVESKPVHASPVEHQATPDRMVQEVGLHYKWEKRNQHGNFVGWIQYRKTIADEHITSFKEYN